MNSMEKLSRQIAKATRGSKTKPYDTKGVVKSVKDGVAMVHFYGGVDETPVEMSINATVGDEVYVRSSGGRAFIVGNNSKPPTDDSTAILARLRAIVAEKYALLAHQAADNAMGTAQEASTTATEAKGIAETADGKADDAVEAVSTTIESDTIHYLATSYNSGVTTADSPSTYGTWTTTVQTIDSTKRYLWTYHTYHKVSGQSINTTPVITGVYGQTGASVTGITEYYAVSATNEPPADSAFTPNVIQPTASTPYLWNMEMVTYSDGNSRFMGKHILMTYNQGTEGRGIASVVEYYARNNSTTAPADSDFGTSVVLPTAQYKYVWNYEVVNYTDGLNPTKTDKRIIGTYGEKGDSPTITTTKNGKTTTIYADGVSIGAILDGLDGDMPTVSKSGDTVTIVDGAGNTVTVKDGQDGQSIKGDDGTPAYLHIAWANSADGTVGFSTVDAVNKQYMGTYTDSTATDSQSPTSYRWLKVKGEQGVKGDAPTITTTKNGKTTTVYADGVSIGTIIDGLDGDSPVVSKTGDTVTIEDGAGHTVTIKDGKDGQSIKGDDGDDAYFHVAWANSADGVTDFSTVSYVGKQYMGTYTDHTQADSQTPADYSWVKIRGEDGTSVTILGSYATYAELIAAHPTGAIGDAYMVNGDLYVWNGTAWDNVGQIRGPQGGAGDPAYLHIAWANSSDGTEDFSTVVAIGKTYMGTYADNVISDSLLPSDYNWVKIKGEQGEQGIQGIQGVQGEQGIQGVQGIQGEQGDAGVSITSVQPQYCLSTSPSSAPSGPWGNTLTYETGKYIWTRDMIYYDDNTNAPSTAIYNQALTEACANAEDALNLAEGIDEHFWYDNTGAHITKVTQDNWNDSTSPDYHSGGNTLITSDGLAVRKGTVELASFTGSGAQIGRTAHWHANISSNGFAFSPPSGANGETIKISIGDNDYGQLLFSYTDSGYLYETYLCNGEVYMLRYNQSSLVDAQSSLTVDGLTVNDGENTSSFYGADHATIGGHPSGLYTEDVLIVDGLTVEHGNYNTTNKSVAKTGYTPIGIVGMHLANATTGGTYNTFVFPHSWYLSGTTAYFTLRNTHASTDAKIKITATILYAKV